MKIEGWDLYSIKPATEFDGTEGSLVLDWTFRRKREDGTMIWMTILMKIESDVRGMMNQLNDTWARRETI